MNKKQGSTSPNPNLFFRAFSTCGVIFLLGLSACGGGSDNSGSSTTQDSPSAAAELTTLTATGVTTLDLGADIALDESVAAQELQAAFHLAPMLLDTPDDADAYGGRFSAHRHPHRQGISPELSGLSSRHLSPEAIEAFRRYRAGSPAPADSAVTAMASGIDVAPMASGTVVSTYTPAQIRAAYGLPAMPVTGSTLTTTQAAQLGSGQTIYIVDAMHDPSVTSELAAFNQKFGLPGCTSKAIASTASLPLVKASTSACELSVVYSTASGGMTTAVPAYNSGWATEIALDVQWAHATAPLARIVLIESADATLNSLLGAIKLANLMGPGIVSMSFGANEGNWTASVDSVFGGSGMTYLAATGDNGAAVSWPAVSTNVVAVGGTSLTYSGSGARSEVSWSGTGGGTSLYTALPSYQTSAVPGLSGFGRRTVADVAFNADPATGQYVAVIASGSSTVQWLSAGGTSLSTPQWAGLIAVANASRVLSAKAVLGAPHAVLYGQIAAVPSIYANAFSDVAKGSDGTCATCTAKIGYDPLSGLGTPNFTSLLSALTGSAIAVPAPVVTSASITGAVGTALSFTVSASSGNALSYALSGAPSGMLINSSSGVVTWPTPLAGSYVVTVTGKDTKTGSSGQGTYTVTIAAPQPPSVGAATITGKPGTPLSFAVTTSATGAVTYSLSGAPAGMTISGAGVVTWANPVVGTYSVTVTAKSTSSGLSGKGLYSVKIAAAGPVITAAPTTGVAGKTLTGTISISDPGAVWLSLSLTGAPLACSSRSAG